MRLAQRARAVELQLHEAAWLGLGVRVRARVRVGVGIGVRVRVFELRLHGAA